MGGKAGRRRRRRCRGDALPIQLGDIDHTIGLHRTHEHRKTDPVPLRGGSTEHPGGGERPGARVCIGTEAGSHWGAAAKAVGDRDRVMCVLVPKL